MSLEPLLTTGKACSPSVLLIERPQLQFLWFFLLRANLGVDMRELTATSSSTCAGLWGHPSRPYLSGFYVAFQLTFISDIVDTFLIVENKNN